MCVTGDAQRLWWAREREKAGDRWRLVERNFDRKKKDLSYDQHGRHESKIKNLRKRPVRLPQHSREESIPGSRELRGRLPPWKRYLRLETDRSSST
jgi:hypothetical protein